MMPVRKAVITAAGWGTRFLPVTRSQPKEMLPLVDRPLIQYAVAEALASGIEQVVIITSPGKRAIEDYFRPAPELENYLESKGETALLRQMREISGAVGIRYIHQEEPLGLGHAVLTAREAIGDEPFAVILPDDVIDSRVPTLKGMIALYERYDSGVLSVATIADEDTRRYGVIEPEEVAAGVYRVLSLVEKPEPAQAPSRLGIVGRYILTPRIFDAIRATGKDDRGELQLTDALQRLLKREALYACELEGTRYDTGTPPGWLKANVALALKRKDIGPEFRGYLKKLLDE
jgi:UTP--glucose-1-phosphate uridylyltransferase